jgi:hypothetical protein
VCDDPDARYVTEAKHDVPARRYCERCYVPEDD